MPYRVTLQMPVECYEGKIALFLLPDVVLPMPPTIGATIKGGGAYKTLPEASPADTVILGIGYDLTSGVVFCTVQKTEEKSMDAHEFLNRELKPLDENWMLATPDMAGEDEFEQPPPTAAPPPSGGHQMDDGWGD